VGDIIQSLDGSPISDASKLLQVLAKRQPGDHVKLGILRDRRLQEIDVTLASRQALFEER